MYQKIKVCRVNRLLLHPMKFFAVIMAFLVLTLSCLPCADDAFAVNTKANMEAIQQHNQQDNPDHNDACSPFCHCTCCAGFSLNHNSAAVSDLVIFCNKSFASYLPDNIIEVSLPIWQPPQLV